MAVEIEVKGLDALHKLMQQFPANVEKNILRGALRAGATVFRDRARELCPVGDSGALKKSIKVKTSGRGAQAKATVVAGDDKAFYSQMIEYGTYSMREIPPSLHPKSVARKNRRIRKRGPDPTGVKPQPFMRPAFDEKSEAALEKMSQYLAKRIDKEFKKRG